MSNKYVLIGEIIIPVAIFIFFGKERLYIYLESKFGMPALLEITDEIDV